MGNVACALDRSMPRGVILDHQREIGQFTCWSTAMTLRPRPPDNHQPLDSKLLDIIGFKCDCY